MIKISDRPTYDKVSNRDVDGIYNFEIEMNLTWARMTTEEKNKMLRYVELLKKENKTIDELKEILDLNDWQCENEISTAVMPTHLVNL
jgi:hypothetical protein